MYMNISSQRRKDAKKSIKESVVADDHSSLRLRVFATINHIKSLFLGGSLERVLELVRKEFLQLFRDPRMWRVVFIAPLIQLMMFGYAVSTDVRNVSTFVVDSRRWSRRRARWSRH